MTLTAWEDSAEPLDQRWQASATAVFLTVLASGPDLSTAADRARTALSKILEAFGQPTDAL